MVHFGKWSVLIIVLLCLLIAVPVAAETLTGNLSITGVASYNYAYSGSVGPGGSSNYNTVKIYQIQNIRSPTAYVHFPNSAALPTYSNATFVGGSASFTGRINSNTTLITNGTIGYQRAWSGSTEVPGYIYLTFNDWNIGANTGDKDLTLTYSMVELGMLSGDTVTNSKSDDGAINPPDSGTYPGGYMSFWQGGLSHPMRGTNTFNLNTDFQNTYTATKPSGIGISGSVNKTPQGTTYPSRVFITNTTGYPLASEVAVDTTDFSFNIAADQIKICVIDGTGSWFNTSVLFNATTSVTPTPTPIAGAVYTMTTSTDYVNVSGSNTVTISSVTDPALADLKFIAYDYVDSSNPDGVVFREAYSSVYQTAYTKVGSTWYGYDSAAVDYTNTKAGIPNPITLNWFSSEGDKTLRCTLQNSAGDYTILTRTIHVGQGDQPLIETRIQAMDGTNGGLLGMVQMQIYNHNTRSWLNLSPNDGLGTIITPAGTILSFYAQKPGFTNASMLNQPAQNSYTYALNLFTGPAAGAGFVNYYVTVKDTMGNPIGGATIVITNTVNGTVKSGASSSLGGAQIFNLSASTLHTFRVSKTGWQTQSGSFTTSTTSGNLDVFLLRSAPTVTATVPTLPGQTATPTTTANQSFFDPTKALFRMMGATELELNLLLAGFTILVCVCLIGGFASQMGSSSLMGAEMGAGIGVVFAVGFGFIPLWVLIAVIIIVIGVVTLRGVGS